MVLHGEIRKLGKKRSRTEINVMLKEGTCSHQENKRKKRKVISAEVKCSFVTVNSAQCKVIFIHLFMEPNTKI